MRRKLFILLLALSLPALYAAGSGPAAGLKLSDIPASLPGILADPDSRAYYLYTVPASGGGEVVAYKSPDLIDWEGPVSVFRVTEGSWADPAEAARAPEVHAYRGNYYLFVTLSNKNTILQKPPKSWRVNTMEGTQVFVGASPIGPFVPVPPGAGKPYTPESYVALDGTLYVEGDLAWMVYVHDWTQVVDATVEAVRLKADLSAPVGEARHLFKASDAPWLAQQTMASREPRYYTASGPFLYRPSDSSLIMIWSSLKDGKSAIQTARSVTGKVRGPWKQEATLLDDGGAQGTIFKTFDGRLMLAVGRPASGGAGVRAGFIELEDVGGALRAKSGKAN